MTAPAFISTPDALIRRWQEQAAQLDTCAARIRASGQGRFQVHAWEARAQALRDCASELWQGVTGETDPPVILDRSAVQLSDAEVKEFAERWQHLT